MFWRKMKNRIIALMIIVFLLPLYGCNKDTSSTTDDNEKAIVYDDNDSNKNEKLVIYDNKEQVFDEIYHFGNTIQIDDGFIYSKWSESNEFTSGMEYYCYNYDNKKSVFLGNIDGWSLQTQETAFISNHVFFFVSTGDITSYETRELKLIDINLEQCVLSEVFSEKGGFPYSTIEKMNDSVLMAKVYKNGSGIEEYNTKTGQIKKLKSFEYDDEKNVGEAIRSLSVDEENHTISLLVLKNEMGASPNLSIDTFDYDFKFLNRHDISSVFSDENEIIQGVLSFECNDNYFYYENFSVTRYLGLFKDNEIEIIDDVDESFEMSHEITKDNHKLFYQLGDNKKCLYLFDINSGQISKTTLKTKDERYYIINMSKNKDYLEILLDCKDSDSGDKLDTVLYNINLSDLDFKLIESKT